MQLIKDLKKWRRKKVKKTGKKLVRWLDGFLGRQSLIGDKPVFDPADFDFVPTLENNWQAIRKELDAILSVKSALPSFHELSPDQKRISHGDHWKMFVLYGFGRWAQRNTSRCPETVEILKQIPGLRNAFFSILAPHFHVTPHCGVSKAVIRCQLALKVPQDRENLFIRVDKEIMHWTEGKCMVFDDTYNHEVQNNSDETRAVLFLDIDRPMAWRGRLASRILLKVIQWTAYVKDARTNLDDYEDRFEQAIQRAESFQITDDEESKAPNRSG
ncbi:MAG: aspartyl/asparaginyl beta-hydroxylase domain-containing protein [gamma proteobacterium symbiont of Bathyaustriella thionipta]|nr:aspartyl/asparaginyl beta-hydroxylase domain-containing protein [gamma proteobacterium symbiont of Bathyaustriella thionipta]